MTSDSETRLFNDAGFNQYLSEHCLMAARCTNCGMLYLPPRPMCSRCYSTHMVWQGLSGEGELTGFTTIYVGLPALAAEGYTRDEPYCTGVVRLVEGPVITGRILGFDCAYPEAMRIGMPVQVAFLDRGAGSSRMTLLAFRERKNPASGNPV